MAHILIIGGHEETFKLMDGLSFRMSLFQVKEGITSFQEKRAEQIFIFDYSDTEESIRQARALHARDPLDGVVSFTEYGLIPAALIVEALGVKGNSPQAVRLTRDKVAMRQLLKGTTIGTTRFKKCSSHNDVTLFFREVGGNIILKPSFGSGSAGVFHITQSSEIETAWQKAQNEHAGPVIAEEFIDGPEYSVECLTRDGTHEIIAITEKKTTGVPRYIEIGHKMPAPLTPTTGKEIADTVTSFLTKIGQSLGPAHIEIRRSSNGVKIIEGNTRAGGGFIWQLVKEAIGVDLIRETMSDILGQKSERKLGVGAGCVHFFSFENSVIKSVKGMDVAKSSPGIIRLDHSLETGRVLGPLRSGDDRQGAIVAVGKDLSTAEANMVNALRKIEIQIEPLVSKNS